MNAFQEIINNDNIVKHYFRFRDNVHTESINKLIGEINKTKWGKAEDIAFIFYISTFGGSLYSVQHLVTQLRKIKRLKKDETNNQCYIITIAYGACHSAGTVLHMCGDIRLSNVSCNYMIHDYHRKDSKTGKVVNISSYKKERRSIKYRKYIHTYTSIPNLSKRRLYNMLKRTTFMSATETHIYGFSHDVINVDKIKNICHPRKLE